MPGNLARLLLLHLGRVGDEATALRTCPIRCDGVRVVEPFTRLAPRHATRSFVVAGRGKPAAGVPSAAPIPRNLAMSPSLSVCLFTNDPPLLVADMLSGLQGVADEIVVAVDRKVPEERLGPLERVADVLVRRTFVPPLEANLAWLHGLCSGDWILRLDGDQVPSAALVQELTESAWYEGVTHASIPMAWVGPDGTEILDQHPWHPDPGIRLFLNDPEVVEISDEVHAPPTVNGPHRILEGPIYELGLATTDFDDREAKSRRYQRLGGVKRTDLGLVVNTTYYLPELLTPPPRTRPITERDVDRVAHLVALGRSERRHPTVAPPNHVVRVDDGTSETAGLERARRVRPTASASPDRELPNLVGPSTGSGSDEAQIKLLDKEPLRWISGRNRNLYLRVTNSGTSVWQPGTEPQIRLGMQMLDATGNVTGVEQRCELPVTIEPGRTEVVRFHAAPPPPGGSLLIGMVREGVSWFGQRNVAVDQVPPRTVTISSGVNPFAHLGDDLIAEAVLDVLYRRFPDVEPVLLVDLPGDVGERFGVRTAPAAGAVIHRSGRAGRVRATTRVLGLMVDARRVGRGLPVRDDYHRGLLDALGSADALLIAPAGALTSTYATESLLPKVAEALAARMLGVPVLVEAGSVGPLANRFDRFAVRLLHRFARHFTVRDTLSLDELAAAGVEHGAATVVPDAATAVEPAMDVASRDLDAVSVDAAAPYVVLSLRDGVDDDTTCSAVGAALAAVPESWPVVLLAHCHGDSVDDRRVLGLLTGSDRVTVVEPSHDSAAVGVVAAASLAVGTRFHQAVLAGTAGVPTVAFVASDYDRLRLSGQHSPGLRIVDVSTPPEAVTSAVAELIGAGPVTPTDRWSPDLLAEALGGALPPPPPLP